MEKSLKEIAKMIDHSLLHPQMTDSILYDGCKIALKYDVASVCIKPYAVSMAKEILRGSDVKVGTVIGFPHGIQHIDIKLKETELAIAEGAEELDIVINTGKALSEDWDYIIRELKTVNGYVKSHKTILKVIFENDFLTDESYKVRLCEICNNLETAYVKTSTGYGFTKQDNGFYDYIGAVDNDLILMRHVCNDTIRVKAAGKVRTLDDILRVRALGVTRVGATATEEILNEAKKRGFK